MNWSWTDGAEPSWTAESGKWFVKATFKSPVMDKHGGMAGDPAWNVGVGRVVRWTRMAPYLAGYLESGGSMYVYPAAEAVVREAGEDLQRMLQELRTFAEAFAVLRS